MAVAVGAKGCFLIARLAHPCMGAVAITLATHRRRFDDEKRLYSSEIAGIQSSTPNTP